MYIKACKDIPNPEGGVTTEFRDYTRIENLSFAPRADVTGATLPIGEFSADIRTADAIDAGSYAELYDDRDVLWARYWVVSAERVAADTLRLLARSPAALLEGATLPAVRYDGRDVRAALDQILGDGDVRVPYALDAAFEGMTLTGYCPEQSPRERLQWVCFAIGAYVRQCFNTQIELKPVDTATRLVPKADTYWRPALRWGDRVTALRVRAYSYTEGTPGPGDAYVSVGNGVTYLVTTQDFTLKNPDVPAAAPENELRVPGVTLVNPGNVSDVLARLSRWAFCRAEADVDVIDNGDILPGDRIIAHIDDALLVSGWVDRAAFAFGAQAMASLHLTGVAELPSGALRLRYVWRGAQVALAEYRFPVGYAYAVQNPWPDWTMNGHRYIFRPLNPVAEGTMPEDGAERDEPCEPALDLCAGVLHVISVDELIDDEGTVKLL